MDALKIIDEQISDTENKISKLKSTIDALKLVKSGIEKELKKDTE